MPRGRWRVGWLLVAVQILPAIHVLISYMASLFQNTFFFSLFLIVRLYYFIGYGIDERSSKKQLVTVMVMQERGCCGWYRHISPLNLPKTRFFLHLYHTSNIGSVDLKAFTTRAIRCNLVLTPS